MQPLQLLAIHAPSVLLLPPLCRKIAARPAGQSASAAAVRTMAGAQTVSTADCCIAVLMSSQSAVLPCCSREVNAAELLTLSVALLHGRP